MEPEENSFKGLSVKKLSLAYTTLNQNNIDEIGSLTQLEEIYFETCDIPMRKYSINFNAWENLINLTVISIDRASNMIAIPDEFCSLPKLKKFIFNSTGAKTIPGSFANLKNSLEYLDLSYNNFKCEIPEYLNDFPHLKYVDFTSNNKLFGKAINNENLETCIYSSFNNYICIEKEMKCLQNSNFPKCSGNPPSPAKPNPTATNDCNAIHTILYENKFYYFEDVIVECLEDNNGKVTQLTINAADLTDEIIEKILSFDTIETLNYQRSSICAINKDQNTFLHYVVKLPKLKELKISYGECTLDWTILKNSSSLKTLIIDTALNNKSFEDLLEIPSLEILNIEGAYNEVSGTGLNIEPLKNLKNLKILYINQATILKGSLSSLQNLKELYAIIDNENLSEITTLDSLEYLTISPPKTGKTYDMGCLKDLKNLKSLYLDGVVYKRNGSHLTGDSLLGLTNIKELTIQSHYLTQELVDRISLLTNLEVLRFKSWGISKETDDDNEELNFDGFKNLSNLTILEFRGRIAYGQRKVSKIPDAIFSLPNLTEFTLTAQKVTSIPEEIGNLKKLQYLDLSNNSIEGEIPQNLSSTLQHIDLSDNDLTGEIPQYFNTFPNLKHLYVFICLYLLLKNIKK